MKEKYWEKRREFRVLLEKKQKKEEEKKLKKLKREEDMWKYINKRGRRIQKQNNIRKGEWRKYFKELLEGTEKNKYTTEQIISYNGTDGDRRKGIKG